MTSEELTRSPELDLFRLMTNPGEYLTLHVPRAVTRARYFNGAPIWLVSRYEDIRAVLQDPGISSNPHSRAADGFPDVAAGQPAAFRPYAKLSIGTMDPPDHSRLHRLLSQAFNPRRVQQLRPRIQQLTDDLLDRRPGSDEVDLLEFLAYPLPISVICELIGVPPEQRERWSGWTQELTWATPDRIAAAAGGIVEDARRLIALRRADPAGDLLSELVSAHDRDAGRLSDDELVSMVITFLYVGHETTVQLIGNGVFALLTHPDQLALLRDRPDLLPHAIDELLRFFSPMDIGVPRFTTEPVEIGGVRIPAGETIQVVYAAGNRDPERFGDPEQLDITRADDQHLAFGWGPHYCLGAALAKAQGEIAIGSLIRRHPGLALAVPPEQVHWRIGFARGLDRLPVRLA